MISVRRHTRAFMLLEVLFVISAATGILFVLSKLLLDGLYLQRVASEHANRVAVTSALLRQLRGDALGAVEYAWTEGSSGPTLALQTCGEGSPRLVHYEFERERVSRSEAGRDEGAFHSKRLEFSARIEHENRWDVLVVDLVVPPPARAEWRPPRVSSERILLPRQPGVPDTTSSQPTPAANPWSIDER